MKEVVHLHFGTRDLFTRVVLLRSKTADRKNED